MCNAGSTACIDAQNGSLNWSFGPLEMDAIVRSESVRVLLGFCGVFKCLPNVWFSLLNLWIPELDPGGPILLL